MGKGKSLFDKEMENESFKKKFLEEELAFDLEFKEGFQDEWIDLVK